MNNDNMKSIDLEQRKGAEQINMMSKMYNMKQNNRMKIKYYDIVTEQYEVITVSLHGFTSKCNKMDL